MIDRPAVTRETCSFRIASVTLLLPSPVAPLVRRWLERRIPALKEHPPDERSPATGSYCLVVLLFRRVSSFESSRRLGAPRHEQSRAKNIPCEAPLPVRYSLFIGSATLGSVPKIVRVAQSASAIGGRCSLAFKSIRRRSRSPRNQQRDLNSRNRWCLRSTDRHLSKLSSIFTRHRLQIVSFVTHRSHFTRKMSSSSYIRDQ